MCSHCAGDYEDPDVTAYDEPEEEQETRIREKRSMVLAIGRLFAALKPFNANPFWRKNG